MEHLKALIVKMQQAGADVTQLDSTTLRVRQHGSALGGYHDRGVSGFATDLQAQYMALDSGGRDRYRDEVFSRTGSCMRELARMGVTFAWMDAVPYRGSRLTGAGSSPPPAGQCFAGAGGAGSAENSDRSRVAHRSRLAEKSRSSRAPGSNRAR